MRRMLSNEVVYSNIGLRFLLLQPDLQFFKCAETVRDLVLLVLSHFRISVESAGHGLERKSFESYVLPSYSNIGSQPMNVSSWREKGL
jgi:hypothetical protein